jgi:Flp pilus assembly protein TadG
MRAMISHFRNFSIAQGGVAAIEFVFILPFLLLLFFGLVDLTGLISVNRKVTQSASVVADLVSQNRNSILKNDITDFYSAVSQIMAPQGLSDVRVEVRGYRPAGGGAVAQIWSTDSGTGPACPPPPSAASLAPLTAAGNDLVVARVCSMYVPAVATFLGSAVLGKTSFMVEETIIQRPRSTGQLMCYRTTVGGAACP